LALSGLLSIGKSVLMAEPMEPNDRPIFCMPLLILLSLVGVLNFETGKTIGSQS
jgi:hypothetical protein